MQNVFVLDTKKKPLVPCHPATARKLLDRGKASVYRRYPFSIIMHEEKNAANLPSMQLKIDPGAQVTGLAILHNGTVVWAGELKHKGFAIKEKLDSRRSLRRGRRNRKTRYRPARFLNRFKPKGWLAPSLISRLDNITHWTRKLMNLCPITSISMELVRFDTQRMDNPEISGVEYQQGELQGYEVREYLLEKYGRKCCYCSAQNVPLEIEHITPKSRGGSNRVDNLCIACHKCNQKKGSKTAAEFGYPNVQAQAKRSMRDTAAVNSVRWALFERLKQFGLPIEVGTGGRTKFNRVKQGYEKAHWIDAACVGESGRYVRLDENHKPLKITAVGRGNRHMQRINAYGFPCATARQPVKRRHGFQTGDIVEFTQPKGKYAGKYIGRISETNKKNFAIITQGAEPQKIGTTNHESFKIIQRTDGYRYE